MMTPEQIQQARELAIEVGDALGPDPAFLACAVLALTEQLELTRARMQRVDGYMVEWRTKARDLKAELAVLKSEQRPTCTCEYPYPREIWDGHHPNCVTEP
jgi:hypothetical protein